MATRQLIETVNVVYRSVMSLDQLTSWRLLLHGVYFSLHRLELELMVTEGLDLVLALFDNLQRAR